MDKSSAHHIHTPEPGEKVLDACRVQRNFYLEGHTHSLKFRQDQLRKIRSMVTENQDRIIEALRLDLQRPEFEAYASEVGFLIQEVNLALRNLSSWSRRRRVGTGLLSLPSSSHIMPQPKGVCLIIAPWNYPFLLVVAPMIAAIAAGNTVILKPAEHTRATAELISELIAQYFEPEVARVVLGEGAVVIPAMMNHFRFDHVFYTGGNAVGKEIAKMAAEKLVPTTLELGGKNPCVVDSSANLKVAAKRIIWSKMINAGQTCIAPDYLLVEERIYDSLQDELAAAINEFYPSGGIDDPDLSGIVDENHMRRLIRFLDDGEIIHGGKYDIERRRMEPTLIRLSGTDQVIMKNEIFGPIFPILTFRNLEEVIGIIDENPFPLSLYYFGRRTRVARDLKRRIASGSFLVNNAVIHFVNSELPFGGIGASGYGNYHGYAGFETFSHFRAEMKTGTWLDPSVKYPPYSRFILWLVKVFMR